ncbi:MAG: hypothetical protein J5935_05660 [Lachnospiraceae bacterium]|nr:hypothetical protein [Lachnospiraceae bacterium]
MRSGIIEEIRITAEAEEIGKAHRKLACRCAFFNFLHSIGMQVASEEKRSFFELATCASELVSGACSWDSFYLSVFIGIRLRARRSEAKSSEEGGFADDRELQGIYKARKLNVSGLFYVRGRRKQSKQRNVAVLFQENQECRTEKTEQTAECSRPFPGKSGMQDGENRTNSRM